MQDNHSPQKTQQPDDDSDKIFLKILGNPSLKNNKPTLVLHAAWIETPIGPMIAIADEVSLYLLEFITKKGLDRELAQLKRRQHMLLEKAVESTAFSRSIVPGNTPPLTSIKKEIAAYFAGTLSQFKTHYQVVGSPFQQQAWQALSRIPYGETRSYAEQAMSLGIPNGYRAVGNANGANQLALIIPCHRVIASDGSLGGYSGGLAIKQWLLDHESKNHTENPLS